jgi:hypothetical protein
MPEIGNGYERIRRITDADARMVKREVNADCRRVSPRGLTGLKMSALSPYIPRVDLDSATLHIGHVPWYLPRRFGAIVRGNDIYFRSNVYVHGTALGIALLGHELTHVGQYRTGMTAVSYLCSIIGGYMNSRYEKAAYGVQARILGDLNAAESMGVACLEKS